MFRPIERKNCACDRGKTFANFKAEGGKFAKCIRIVKGQNNF